MIFVAVPYYHNQIKVIERRVAIAATYCGQLLSGGQICTSPVCFGSTVLQNYNLPNDFSFWDKLSFEYLSKCDELHILCLDGWDTSRGVRAEQEYAIKNNIKIKYIDGAYINDVLVFSPNKIADHTYNARMRIREAGKRILGKREGNEDMFNL